MLGNQHRGDERVDRAERGVIVDMGYSEAFHAMYIPSSLCKWQLPHASRLSQEGRGK